MDPCEACHVCGGPTRDRPSIMWMGGRCFVLMPFCLKCASEADIETSSLTVPIEFAPADVVRRASAQP